MAVSGRRVRAVQACYPRIYLACHVAHVRRRSSPAHVTAAESMVLGHLDERRPMRPTALAAHLGVAAFVGWLLPVGHVASRTTPLPEGSERGYETLRDVASYPRWRSDVTRVDVLEAEGDAVRFREHSRDGAVTLEIVEAGPPSTLVTRIADPDQPFGGTWTFEIAAAPEGSTVMITERGEIYNPLFRVVARFVLGYHRTLDRDLADLARHVSAGHRPPAT